MFYYLGGCSTIHEAHGGWIRYLKWHGITIILSFLCITWNVWYMYLLQWQTLCMANGKPNPNVRFPTLNPGAYAGGGGGLGFNPPPPPIWLCNFYYYFLLVTLPNHVNDVKIVRKKKCVGVPPPPPPRSATFSGLARHRGICSRKHPFKKSCVR